VKLNNQNKFIEYFMIDGGSYSGGMVPMMKAGKR